MKEPEKDIFKKDLKPSFQSEEKLEELFIEYYSPLCNFALKYVSDSFTAEEIVQNLFVNLWEKDAIKRIDSPERYLIRSVKFKCIDYLRKENTGFLPVDVSDVVMGTEDSTDLQESDIEPLLHYFAAKLPPKTRDVFLLSRKSGLSYKEIAEELNISPKTVENQMSRALRIMKDLLKENDYLSLLILLKLL